METLPVEMVELIVQQLTPQDLARCSAVCREWREIFNQDWMWRPHCDPELEEPLRTIPCVATPAFVTPEAENSTLSPNCCWKMAFMRENHLWQNWRKKEMMEYKKENTIESGNNVVLSVDFLTDTLVVVWCLDCIQILDVSVMPAAFVAKTDISVTKRDKCRVVGPSVIFVEKDNSVEVFNVDIMNKSIKLKHRTSVSNDMFQVKTSVTKEYFYLCLNNKGSKLTILDLNTGKVLKEEPCPMKVNQNENVQFHRITSSPTSDFVAVELIVLTTNYGIQFSGCYIYSLKQLTFLPGPVVKQSGNFSMSNFTLHRHWFAFMDSNTFNVYNFQTREVLLSHKVNCNDFIFGFTVFCYNSFIFIGHESCKSWVKSYLNLDKTLATLYECSDMTCQLKIINNKVIAIFDSQGSLWKLSGQMVKKWDNCAIKKGCKVNQSFTRVLYPENLNYSCPTWCVSCLW